MILNARLGYLLQHTANALSLQVDQNLQERLDIGYSQFKILMFLEGRSAATQKVIATSLGQTEASISRQIKIMKGAGLVGARINTANRRERMITPTAHGRRVGGEALGILNFHQTELFAGMNKKQQSQLLDLLSSMHARACINPRQPGSCQPQLGTVNLVG